MRMTITITDDGAVGHADPVLTAAADQPSASSAGPAPATPTAAAGNGGDAIDGGPAPEWLRTLIEERGRPATGSRVETPSAVDASALNAGPAPSDG